MCSETLNSLEKLSALCGSHDWYHYMSDDHRVWRRGQDSWNRIVGLARVNR